MRVLLTLLISIFSVGCQIVAGPPVPAQLPPPGSTLVLLRDLDVAPGKARVHIQYGQVVSEREIDVVEPYCQFMTRDLSTAVSPLRIERDRFQIRSAWRTTHSVGLDAMLAGLTPTVRTPDGPSQMTLATELDLYSATQPGVYRLSCRYWADAYERHLYLREIRQTLAGLVAIE